MTRIYKLLEGQAYGQRSPPAMTWRASACEKIAPEFPYKRYIDFMA